jgi:hypothetical protein
MGMTIMTRQTSNLEQPAVTTVGKYIIDRLRARHARQLAIAQRIELYAQLLTDIGLSRQEAMFGRYDISTGTSR